VLYIFVDRYQSLWWTTWLLLQSTKRKPRRWNRKW